MLDRAPTSLSPEQIVAQAVIHERIDMEAPIVSFTAACFGKSFNGEKDVNWSFTPLQKERDAEANPELARRLATALRGLGASNVYAARPRSTAAYAPTKVLKHGIKLGGGVTLLRNGDDPGDVVGGVEYQDTVAFTTGGCPLIVTSERIVAHAGRDCLIDRVRIGGHAKAWRFYESVCDTIMRIRNRRIPTSTMQVWVFFSIPPKHFRHPLAPDNRHGVFNQRLRAYVIQRGWSEQCVPVENGDMYLDLPQLIRAQLIEHGVRDENIHLERAYVDEHDTERVWLDGREGKPRNLTAVTFHL